MINGKGLSANGFIPSSITRTWRLSNDGPPGIPPSSVTGLQEPTRAYTLTGPTSYVPYAITLSAMLEDTPYLTGTLV